MKGNQHMKPHKRIFPAICLNFLLLLIIFLTIACGASTKLVSINLHEAQLNEILHKSANITSSDGWGFAIQNVEIMEGFIRVHGEYFPPNKNVVSGSMDISLAVDDGLLKGEIEKLDMPGFSATSPAFKIINNLVVQQISKFVSEGRLEVKFESVEIQKESVKIVLRYLPQ
jgi:hypothetical protein